MILGLVLKFYEQQTISNNKSALHFISNVIGCRGRINRKFNDQPFADWHSRSLYDYLRYLDLVKTLQDRGLAWTLEPFYIADYVGISDRVHEAT